jgi:type IV pilus assembly protein PilO
VALDINVDFDDSLERLSKIPKAIRLGVVASFLISIAGCYWFFFYEPAQEVQREMIVKAHELQRDLNNARSVANNVPGFEKEVADLESDLALAVRQLPNRKQFEDLLQDISTAGKKVGVSIKSIDRDDEIERDFYAEVPFELEIEGAYHDLARFFEMVSGLPRIVNVGALNIQVSEERRSDTRLKVSGRATTFRFLSDEA